MNDKLPDVLYSTMLTDNKPYDPAFVFDTLEEAEKDARLFLSEYKDDTGLTMAVMKLTPIKYISVGNEEEPHIIENRVETLERKLEPNL